MSETSARWTSRIGLTVLATAALGMFAVPAQAASAGVVQIGWDPNVQDVAVVQYKAAKGKANTVVISLSGRNIVVDDKHPIKAGKGCTAVKGDKTKVTCGAGEYLQKVQVHTYDRNDRITNNTRLALVAHGGAGNDTITGGSSADSLYGGAGKDTIHGRGGADYVVGDSGDDKLYGDAGNDELYGDTGSDTLHGGAGTDALSGDQGKDKLYGGAGNDYLTGEDWKGAKTRDLLAGDAGSDWCHADAKDVKRSCES
ncbi:MULTISPECIES: calcium-binding protein [Actinoplanes]|uniref:calcium-binding protein n=1 Tax=Actinoplanes TaxID=1865 RepID=UPI0006986E65|nr:MULTISPECIES: calcium-binding protein [Actinoplanes]GLY05179.1 hypothetical protein Acsp01_55580 [Actinoplanes sp. NBRC 101535]